MNIFSTSDFHGSFFALSTIISYINKKSDIDVVLFCGDIFGDGNYCYTKKDLLLKQEEDYLCFREMIKEIKCSNVYYILGNHDVYIPKSDDMSYLPNAVKMKLESKFVPFEKVCIKHHGTDRECNELEIAHALENLELYKKFVVAHQPPLGTLDMDIVGWHYGSKAVNDFIISEKPAIYFCGHVHEAFGVENIGETMVINSSCYNDQIRGITINTETLEYEKVYLHL
jgi:hypothetical protein